MMDLQHAHKLGVINGNYMPMQSLYRVLLDIITLPNETWVTWIHVLGDLCHGRGNIVRDKKPSKFCYHDTRTLMVSRVRKQRAKWSKHGLWRSKTVQDDTIELAG